jgi:hypothetical protein
MNQDWRSKYHGLTGVIEDAIPSKIIAYNKFLKTPEGKIWKENIRLANREYDRNFRELRRRR